MAKIGDRFFVSDGYDSRPEEILAATPSLSSTLVEEFLGKAADRRGCRGFTP
jgi:hypothetical protein